MSILSNIEWTGFTWNPTRGCNECSSGCARCYAKKLADRNLPGYEQGFDPRLVPHKLAEPLKWLKPSLVFVNSMSDLFHENIPFSYIRRVCRVMRMANWHQYQALTKRHERMNKLLNGKLKWAAELDHVWWGVSVENRRQGLPRIDALRECPAKMRFLSVEPLLEDLGELNLDGIHWVIVGGESGPGCRPLNPKWVENVYRQCQEKNVPFFFKQWGHIRNNPDPEDPTAKYNGGSSKGGRLLNGQCFEGYPAYNFLPVKSRARRSHLIEKVTNWYPYEIKNKVLIDPKNKSQKVSCG